MAASLQTLGYLPVSTSTLSAATVLDFNLYMQRPGRTIAELYREKSLRLTDEDLERLRQGGVDHLYIKQTETDGFRQYLQQHVLHDAAIPTPVRFRALRDITRVAFEDAMRLSNSDSMVDVAASFGRDLAGMLAEQTPVFEE